MRTTCYSSMLTISARLSRDSIRKGTDRSPHLRSKVASTLVKPVEYSKYRREAGAKVGDIHHGQGTVAAGQLKDQRIDCV